MEQNLQTAIDLLNKNVLLSAEEKNALISKLKEVDKKITITEFKLDRTEKVKRTTAILLEETIEELEQKRKAVEAQNRELEIEAALEKVRSRSLALNKSDEFNEVIKVVFERLQELQIPMTSVSINVIIEGSKDTEAYICGAGEDGLTLSHIRLVHFDHPVANDRYRAFEQGVDFFTKTYSAEEKNSFFKYEFEVSDLKFIPADIKKMVMDSQHYTCSVAFTKNSMIVVNDFQGKSLSSKEIDIVKRFAKVFEQAYIRFLDLQKSEVQVYEAQKEASLERVRSRSMGMQKSEELKDVIQIVYEQLVHLNINVEHAGFIMDYKERDDMHIWLADKHAVPSEIYISYFDSPHWNSFIEAKKKGLDFFANHLFFEEKNKFYHELFKLFPVPDDAKEYYFNCPGLAISTVLLDNVGLYIENFSGTFYTDEENKTLMRFGKVFQQTHTRFLDLQKAEEQARESQIQLALERVRARTMAMHQSAELANTSSVLFQQIKDLGFETWSCGFCIWQKDDFAEVWMGADSGGLLPPMMIPYKEEPTHHEIYLASLRGDAVHEKIWQGQALENHYDFLRKIPSVATAIQQLEDAGLWLPAKQCYYVGFFKKGYLLLITKEPNTEMYGLTRRFANVFEQTYTRFLDLQKAEAQTKEARIEMALEKVRGQSMAMGKSDDLSLVVSTVFNELEKLEVKTLRCGIGIINDTTRSVKAWITTSTNVGHSAELSGDELLSGHPLLDTIFIKWKEQKSFSYILEGNDLIDYYKAVGSTDFQSEFAKEVLTNSDARHFYHCVMFPSGGLFTFSETPFSEETNRVLKRFADAFYHAYKRFEDLQKAEAQSRESQIELSLERVRAKTMAMHNSADVGETAAVMVDELKKLGIQTIRCGIGIMHEPGEMEVWTISTDEKHKTDIVIGWLDMNMHPLLHGAFESWRNNMEFYSYDLLDDDLLNYYNAINNYPGYPIRYDTSALPKQIHHNEFHFTEGTLFAFSLEQLTEGQKKIFKRFASVFGQTYRRYLDLKNAEAQAREAQIETALERVRSRTLAMQKSDELAETSAVLFRQLILLGISPNRLYISIMKDDKGEAEFWITDEDGSKVTMAYEDNLNNNQSFKKMFDGWQQQKKSLVIDMKGNELQQYFQYLSNIHVPFKGGLTQKRRLQYVAYFSKGFIGMASPDEQPKETIDLLERFAYVFNLTFTRFNDLQIAEAHALQAEEDLIKLQTEKRRAEDALIELRATQKQLVQSEKMASLGELTAGIAHEIQNPLNFVNNFSEVSKELIDEMKVALENGDKDEAEHIANDIIQNLEKINHHGKRADAIVKGMLQHSRTSSSQKEPTDINALCHEYIRLCYHGLRAKDSSFNSDIITDFDKDLSSAEGKINIIPQDISRVILNVLTNAFYAVKEPSNSLKGEQYKPLVTVTTKAVKPPLGDLGVILTVKDNGNGIPQKIVDKIFQPFFTTKPTGQGTGLGLSLSYDIIKAHGGNIKVETKEGEGTMFIIQLPAV